MKEFLKNAVLPKALSFFSGWFMFITGGLLGYAYCEQGIPLETTKLYILVACIFVSLILWFINKLCDLAA